MESITTFTSLHEPTTDDLRKANWRYAEKYGHPRIDGVEDLNLYCKGGFHPVHYGDLLGPDGRFEVANKLGHGGYATVWLCFDHWDKDWKAVKILQARDSHGSSENYILGYFRDVSQEELDKHHISLPLETFYINGPNGRHLCNIFPVFGPSLQDTFLDFGHIPGALRSLCVQMAEAMAFLHSKGVCHGDFRTSNILFKLDDISTLSWQDMFKMIPHRMRIEVPTPIPNPGSPREPNPHLPDFVYPSTPLKIPDGMVIGDIVVTDFGEAYHVDERRKKTGIPLRYAAPEVVLQAEGRWLGFGADVWALGSAILEVRLGEIMDSLGPESWVRELEVLLGPLPEPYRSVWYKSRGHHDTVPELQKAKSGQPVMFPTEQFEEIRKFRRGKYESYLELLVRKAKVYYMAPGERLRPDEAELGCGGKIVRITIESEEADLLLNLLAKIFRYHPEDRILAAEALDHPWFAEHFEARDHDPSLHDEVPGEVPSSHHLFDDESDESMAEAVEAQFQMLKERSEASVAPTQDVVLHQPNKLFELLAWFTRAILVRLYDGPMSLGGLRIYDH